MTQSNNIVDTRWVDKMLDHFLTHNDDDDDDDDDFLAHDGDDHDSNNDNENYNDNYNDMNDDRMMMILIRKCW